MKKTILAAAFSVAMIPLFASAADGTVNVVGNVSAGTCVPTSSSLSQTVTMPTVATTSLATAGASSTVTPFQIQLMNCGTSGQRVGVSLDGAANGDVQTGRLKNTAVGGATNVQVAVVDRATNANLNLPNGRAFVTSTATGEANIPLGLRYVATNGAAGAGAVNTAMEFSIVYE